MKKTLKQLFLIVPTAIVTACFVSALVSFDSPKVKTIAIASNDMARITAFIASYSKIGYEVKFIHSQPVAVAIGGQLYSHEAIKGEVLLVMTK